MASGRRGDEGQPRAIMKRRGGGGSEPMATAKHRDLNRGGLLHTSDRRTTRGVVGAPTTP